MKSKPKKIYYKKLLSGIYSDSLSNDANYRRKIQKLHEKCAPKIVSLLSLSLKTPLDS